MYIQIALFATEVTNYTVALAFFAPWPRFIALFPWYIPSAQSDPVQAFSKDRHRRRLTLTRLSLQFSHPFLDFAWTRLFRSIIVPRLDTMAGMING
jgi:hypothetical protein